MKTLLFSNIVGIAISLNLILGFASCESREKSYYCSESEFSSAVLFNFEEETDDGPLGSIILTIHPTYISKPIGFKGKYLESNIEDLYDGMITIFHISPESDGNWERISSDAKENVIFYKKEGNGLILTNKTSSNPFLSYLDESKFLPQD